LALLAAARVELGGLFSWQLPRAVLATGMAAKGDLGICQGRYLPRWRLPKSTFSQGRSWDLSILATMAAAVILGTAKADFVALGQLQRSILTAAKVILEALTTAMAASKVDLGSCHGNLSTLAAANSSIIYRPSSINFVLLSHPSTFIGEAGGQLEGGSGA